MAKQYKQKYIYMQPEHAVPENLVQERHQRKVCRTHDLLHCAALCIHEPWV